jgi:hypothetical protein
MVALVGDAENFELVLTYHGNHKIEEINKIFSSIKA